MLFKDEQIILLIIAGTAMLLLLGMFIVSFLLAYQKKQGKNKMEKEQLKSSFQQELLKTQIEIQEQTFNYVSREIHDNITQVLSFVKLNLGMLGSHLDDDNRSKINENRELIAQTITDLRNLSKSLSFEHIGTAGLVSTMELEAGRINRSGIIDLALSVEGESYSLGEQRELVVFRIYQEALNNVFKHAGAGNVKIGLYYNAQLFNLTIEDDGYGFDAERPDIKGGSGLRNMQNRAALVGAAIDITSSPGKGCLIKLSLNPQVQQIYANETHPNSLSGRPQTF